MTRPEQVAFVRTLITAVRTDLESRFADWPEAWDGHDLRELIAHAFDRERTLTPQLIPGRPAERHLKRRRDVRRVIEARDLTRRR